MPDLVEITGIGGILTTNGIEYDSENFEELYGRLVADPARADVVAELEAGIRAYFAGLELPDSVTLYDELLLSLRAKDLIATFNWDPFLLQAYGRNRHIGELPNVVFLHGNVAVGVCTEHRHKGFLWQKCQICASPFEPVPLLYPVSQNYAADPFIAGEWEVVRDYLQRAYVLTVFGYGAPESDVEAIEILTTVWQNNPTRDLAEVEIIDIKSAEQLEIAWQPFFVRQHYGIASALDVSWLFRYPRRTCEALAMATLQLTPCSDNWLPRLSDLEELQHWVAPLVDAELALQREGRPFDCWQTRANGV